MIVPGFERGDSALSTPQRQKRHFTHFYSEVICMYYSLCYCCLLLLKCHWWIPRERSSYSNSFAFQQHFSISYKPSKLNINQLFLHIFSLSINCRNRIGTTTLQTETSKANRSSGSKVFFFHNNDFCVSSEWHTSLQISGKFCSSEKKWVRSNFQMWFTEQLRIMKTIF